tara:strand:- start:110 stop:1027 length:918 start_codon:yes stop_codon:yes gene_type:complete
MLERMMEYGERDKGPDTALVTLVFLVAAIAFISYSGVLDERQTQEQVATSEVVPDRALVAFRVACAALAVFTLSWVALDPKGGRDFPLYFEDREIRPRRVFGPTRLAAYTMWHFALLGVSFGVSGAASWIHLSGGEVPEWMLVAGPALFSTSYTCAILVTCVISYHIIGNEIRKGHSVDHLFSWYEIVMHNANVGLLGVALLVNSMEVDWRYFAFPIVFGVAYVAWAAIYAKFIEGVFIYDFMDYRRSGAPLIYMALLTIQTSFFVAVLAMDRLAEWNLNLAAALVFGLTWQITTVRNPSSHSLD